MDKHLFLGRKKEKFIIVIFYFWKCFNKLKRITFKNIFECEKKAIRICIIGIINGFFFLLYFFSRFLPTTLFSSLILKSNPIDNKQTKKNNHYIDNNHIDTYNNFGGRIGSRCIEQYDFTWLFQRQGKAFKRATQY